MRVVIACGGTGGHIYPALAVAEALREQEPAVQILFVGGSRLETQLVPQAGWALRAVAARPIPRTVTPGVLTALGALVVGTVQSARILRDFRAQVVLATGGYVSAPVGVAAAMLRVPVVLQEQNLVPGLTTRMLARLAARVSIPHETVWARLPAGVVTGVPIRRGATGGDRARGVARFGLEAGRFTVLVLGGSQGARSLNEAMLEAARALRAPDAVQVLHQAGKGQAEWVARRAAQIRTPRYVAVGYIEDVADAYACADLVVCRAGAGTLAEVTANGLPAVVVPYPHAAEGHQDANARLMERAGAAVVIADRDLTGARLAEVIDALREDAPRARAMAEASRRLGRPGAAAAVAALVRDAAHKERA
ncbi:MAG: undecaprenyldiphospho-muramoylpentapeptide beta-N-acetylglucosaminyltransferase [Armatimonadota bacterium]|nr:undecaprenyldiphospho-muramoylpentapeptide beta-N-acetylglucosaminyltransferase [Armatimonadota bacterium]MDR7451752.1 undecaprenyldiphospho-muramoylpentapeptide beta-N-acetylglucosaminyltransferase [Armatimonadota bacterium]MDR7467377.1 undecaprenyldiphospho-muramoylpentapeptide beta-N-acetylglucosaminyltransferase [Armatimonadota bacterium]MDR7494147.1 undecaprenyldiphospho-muramoylpentapeptide beta-N-acetylglucosaminyltransferase [Armatimonadota bacterium]MDR7498887.1 undecaprenyldiphosph